MRRRQGIVENSENLFPNADNREHLERLRVVEEEEENIRREKEMEMRSQIEESMERGFKRIRKHFEEIKENFDFRIEYEQKIVEEEFVS